MSPDPRPGLILQHGPQGPPARLAEWLHAREIAHQRHRSWDEPTPPEAARFAFIATLGSAHSATDAEPGWIADEIALLRDALNTGVPVLGLCWGAQALALAMGATVMPAPQPEIGWLAVDSHDSGVPAGPWLHFHYEAFTVPALATELARSPAGPAAFRAGPHLGVQFHPEATGTMGEIWGHSDPRLHPAEVATLAADGARYELAARAQAFALFDAWYRTAGLGT